MRRRVDEVAALLGLSDLLDRKPAQLSGGQRQRVAMGRAIVRTPTAFLMDEPLSNLDAKLRVGMRASLAQLHRQLGTTTVYVTHDQVEAMTLGQRVAVMRDGRILQVDVPQRLYEQPRDVFVAAFIGSPAMNLVDATIDGDDAAVRPVPRPARSRSSPGCSTFGLEGRARDQAGELRGRGLRTAELPTIDVDVLVVEELGSDAHVFFPIDAPRITPETIEAEGEDAAQLVADEVTLLNARVDPRTAARVGSGLQHRGRPRTLPLLRSRDGREPARAAGPRAREPGTGPGRAPDVTASRRLVLTTRALPLGLVPS